MKAFTLLEFVVVMFIIALLAVFALPAWHHIIVTSRAQRAMTQLWHAINYTRSVAIYRHNYARLSPLGQWQQGYIVSLNGQVIKKFQLKPNGGAIHWDSFPGYHYLEFTPQGFTANQNGTFSYLDKTGRVIEKLVISQSGRVRVEDDLS